MENNKKLNIIGLVIVTLSGLFILLSGYPWFYYNFDNFEEIEQMIYLFEQTPHVIEGGQLKSSDIKFGITRQQIVGIDSDSPYFKPLKQIILKNVGNLSKNFDTVELHLIASFTRENIPYYTIKTILVKNENEYIYVTSLEIFKEWSRNYRKDYFLSKGIIGLVIGFVVQIVSFFIPEGLAKKEDGE